jgi:hypothetical protein
MIKSDMKMPQTSFVRSRLWLDKDTHMVVRAWTDEEQQTIDPHTHIFEKYWSYYCSICSFIPMPCCNEGEVRRSAIAHKRRFGDRHKCIVEYRDHELVCLETREELSEDCGVWIIKHEIY